MYLQVHGHLYVWDSIRVMRFKLNDCEMQCNNRQTTRKLYKTQTRDFFYFEHICVRCKRGYLNAFTKLFVCIYLHKRLVCIYGCSLTLDFGLGGIRTQPFTGIYISRFSSFFLSLSFMRIASSKLSEFLTFWFWNWISGPNIWLCKQFIGLEPNRNSWESPENPFYWLHGSYIWNYTCIVLDLV